MKYLPLESASAGHIGYQQRVKEDNIKHIFDLVRSGKCRSRAELVRAMQLSATSVSGLVEELTARGLIHETGPQQTSQPGRRPISLQFNSDARQLVVFTIGSGAVRYSLLDLGCRIRESLTVPIERGHLRQQDAGEILASVCTDILKNRAKLFDHSRVALVGISYPGHYLEEARALSMKSKLNITVSEDSIQRLQRRFNLPFYFANRTMCMAYAEKKRMDAESPDSPEAEDMLFVTVREDVSGALIYNGDLFTGPHNLAGEIGHISIDHGGKPCSCGSVGCLERYVNLDAILEQVQAACLEAGIEPPASIDDLSKNYLDTPAVAGVLYHSADLLATGLYSALCTTGVRQVVLGGGIEALGEGFLHRVYHSICSRSLLIHHLDLSYAQLGQEADSIGLAQYFLDKLFTITM